MTSTNGHTSPRGAQTTGRTVVGLFKERSQAEEAIRDLKEAGFTDGQIGVVTRTEPAPEEEELGKIVEDTTGGMPEGASIGTLVTVNAGDRTSEAVSTLQRRGADLVGG